MSASEQQDSDKLGARVRGLVERTIQRNIKGLEYFASTAPPVGLTPKDVIHKRGTLNLYHYHPQSDEIYRVPILIVMATTNKSYVLDIAPGQSFVEFLVKKGYDVFVIDWDAPRPEEKRLGLDDYTQDFIPDCIRRIQQETGEEDVTIVGYCMGGVLSTIYAATHPDGPLKNLICFTTPVNWGEMGLFSAWA
ncbi:MAG: alpha/beta fold hydrolase, partial [Amphiplicatus sp.]